MKASKSFVSDIIIICALIFLALCLIIYPADTVSAAADAVNTCLYIVVPSLFPFFVLAVLSSKLGLGDRAGRRLSFIMQMCIRDRSPTASSVPTSPIMVRPDMVLPFPSKTPLKGFDSAVYSEPLRVPFPIGVQSASSTSIITLLY